MGPPSYMRRIPVLDTSGHSPKQSGNRGCSAYYTRGLAPSASRCPVAQSATHKTDNTSHVQVITVRECISVLRTTARALSIFTSPLNVSAIVCGLWGKLHFFCPSTNWGGGGTKKAKNKRVNPKRVKYTCYEKDGKNVCTAFLCFTDRAS
jgi:hypothetical protein